MRVAWVVMTPRDRARFLVLKYGFNATSYQILNPGIHLWFNHDRTAVAGYVEHHGVRVVAGVPICAPAQLSAAVAELEEDARAVGCDVAYFAVEERALHLWQGDADRATVVIGAQPVWHPRALADTMKTHRSLRAQLNRATAKRVVVEEWANDAAAASTALRDCLDEWLASRRMPPLHFLVESDTLPQLQDRRVFVASRDGRVVGFLVASPIATRDGWLVEHTIRGAHAPNGTSELLLHAVATALADSNASLITLGLSPLSSHTPRTTIQPSRAVRGLLNWIRLHGRRFYNFEGLDTYKAKFRPEKWEPVYAVMDGGIGTWKALVAMGAAFGGTSAPPFVLRVMQHALEQELERVKIWRRSDGSS